MNSWPRTADETELFPSDTYTSVGSFSGLDQFTYYVTDGTLNSAVDTVEIDVAMTIVVVDTTPPAEIETAPETPDPITESEPADATDSETSDESTDNDSKATTAATISDATTGQDGSTSTATDVAAEMLSQTAAEIFVSVNLTDVPESGLLNRDSRTLLNSSGESVLGNTGSSGHFLFHQRFTDSPVLAFLQLNRGNTVESDYQQQQDLRNQQQQTVENVVVGTSAVVSTGVSVGYVMWLLRGGSLLTTFLSSLSAWQAFDPLAVLESFDETADEDEDAESLVSLVSGGE
ncbi:MAG: hypothetical protein ABGZ53_28015 [Fuerstiella sp.]|nr:hypothetical protein [Fuerstiella sp.]